MSWTASVADSIGVAEDAFRLIMGMCFGKCCILGKSVKRHHLLFHSRVFFGCFQHHHHIYSTAPSKVLQDFVVVILLTVIRET